MATLLFPRLYLTTRSLWTALLIGILPRSLKERVYLADTSYFHSAGMEKATLWLVLQKVINDFKVVESRLGSTTLSLPQVSSQADPTDAAGDRASTGPTLQEEVQTSGPLARVQESEDKWESITPEDGQDPMTGLREACAAVQNRQEQNDARPWFLLFCPISRLSQGSLEEK